IQCFPRSVSLAWHARELAPASVAVLSRLQRFHGWRTLRCIRAGICQSSELHRTLFNRVSLRRKQPPFRAAHSFLELLAPAGNRIKLDRAQDDGCRRERAVFLRWPVAVVSPCAVSRLVNRQVVNVRVGQRVRGISSSRHSHQRITQRVRRTANRRSEAHRLEIRHVRSNRETKFFLRLLFIHGESLFPSQRDYHRWK